MAHPAAHSRAVERKHLGRSAARAASLGVTTVTDAIAQPMRTTGSPEGPELAEDVDDLERRFYDLCIDAVPSLHTPHLLSLMNLVLNSLVARHETHALGDFMEKCRVFRDRDAMAMLQPMRFPVPAL